MKRVAILCVVLIIFVMIICFSHTAMDPDVFTGQWYSSGDHSIYLFQEGMIYSAKHTIPLAENEYISGAYFCSSNSIYLFADGIVGLEEPKEAYLVQKGDTSIICENKNGSGQIYFARTK